MEEREAQEERERVQELIRQKLEVRIEKNFKNRHSAAAAHACTLGCQIYYPVSVDITLNHAILA